MRSLLTILLFLPTLALAAPAASSGSCDDPRAAERGFWSSLGATVRRALAGPIDGTAFAEVSFPDGDSGTVYGDLKIDPVGGPSFLNLKLRKSNGKTFKLSGHGNGALATKLCAPYERKYPHTYTTVDSKGFFEAVAAVDDVMVARDNDDSIKVRAIHCMAEPY